MTQIGLEELPEKITDLMAQRKWSRYRLAKMSGVSQSTLHKIVKGKTMPRLDVLERIGQAFGMTLLEMLSKENDGLSDYTTTEKRLVEQFRRMESDERKQAEAYFYGISQHKELKEKKKKKS